MTSATGSAPRSVFDSRCVVVGGAGFVGSSLVRRLLEAGAAHVIVVDNLLSSEAANVPADHPRIEFVQASINQESVRSRLRGQVDHLFHLATFHGNQNSIADPLADHENNTLTTLLLCETFSGDDRLQSLVYSSAGCTVAEKTYDAARPTSEDAPVSLRHDSPYQISKLVGEMYLNYYYQRHGLPAVMARFQNVYGPGEILGAGSWRGTEATIWRNVVPTFIYRALNGEPLILHNGGSASRDFIYVDDIVEGLISCAQKGDVGQVYNLATGEETSILELAKCIVALTDSESELVVAPRRDWDRSGFRFGAPDKARRELEFVASTALTDGLSRTVAWFRENTGLIDACVKRHLPRLVDAP